jgi:two-component sensor histidine kinase
MALHQAFVSLDVSALFPSYYPAVLLASLLAGTPAGISVIAGAVLIVWFAYIPPYYEFNRLDSAQTANFLLFAVSTGCVVLLSHLYRDAFIRLRQRDRERELLLHELEHRGRNTYAVVEAIVRNTLVNDRASADAIAGRVRAVSSANDLVNQSDTKTVPLKDLLSLEFALNDETQLHTAGPDTDVSPDAARKLGLVFHELVTNAMKHGALSNRHGRVTVTWRAESAQVHLVWQEQDGPQVLPPQRQGFGSVIVTQSLKSLGGDIAFGFDAAGLRCDMTFNCR